VGKNCQFHLTFRFFPFLLQQKSLITASNVIWFTVLLLYVLMFVFYYVYEIVSVYYLSHCYDIRKQHKSVSQATRPIRWCRSPFPLLSARHQFTLRDHGYRVSAWCGMPVYICPSFHWYPLCLPAEGRSGWVYLGGWLHAKMVAERVTHPSTNRACCWLTLLMQPTMLPTNAELVDSSTAYLKKPKTHHNGFCETQVFWTLKVLNI